MTSEQFAYWLQGYAELTEGAPTAEQWQAIRDHLALVFNKVTPQRITWPGSPTFPADPAPYAPQYRVTCSTLPGGMAPATIC